MARSFKHAPDERIDATHRKLPFLMLYVAYGPLRPKRKLSHSQFCHTNAFRNSSSCLTRRLYLFARKNYSMNLANESAPSSDITL